MSTVQIFMDLSSKRSQLKLFQCPSQRDTLCEKVPRSRRTGKYVEWQVTCVISSIQQLCCRGHIVGQARCSGVTWTRKYAWPLRCVKLHQSSCALWNREFIKCPHFTSFFV